jgi:16S rRNA processing protein RimM
LLRTVLSKKLKESFSLFEIGQVIGTHGLKGELKIKLFYQDLNIKNIKKVFLNKKAFFIDSFRVHKNNLLLKLKEITDINDAELFRNQTVAVAEKPNLEENFYFNEELLTKKVFDQNNNNIGIVTSIIQTPHHNVLTVTNNYQEILIPQVEKFIISVDDTIHVDIRDLEAYNND